MFRAYILTALLAACCATAQVWATERERSDSSARFTLEISAQRPELAPYPIYVELFAVTVNSSWDDPPLHRYQLNSEQAQSRLQIDNLSYGLYAVRLFQDINQNQQLDLNSRGIPLEPFGLSAPSNLRKRPDIQEARFAFTPSQTTLTVSLRYPRKLRLP